MCPGFQADNSLFSGRPNLCRVFMPSTSFLPGYLTSSLHRWSSPASELLTVCCSVTAVSICYMLWSQEKGEILVYFFFQYEMAWLMWTGPLAKGKPNCLSSHLLECRWAGRTVVQHELWASPRALQHQGYEPAPHSYLCIPPCLFSLRFQPGLRSHRSPFTCGGMVHKQSCARALPWQQRFPVCILYRVLSCRRAVYNLLYYSSWNIFCY